MLRDLEAFVRYVTLIAVRFYLLNYHMLAIPYDLFDLLLLLLSHLVSHLVRPHL